MAANEEELHDLLREAEALIDGMATWFRNQPLGCPPVGTAQWQSRTRRVLAADGAAAVAPAPDPLERAKQIRNRVAELEAEIARLTAEHNTLLGTGKVDEEDLAWARGERPQESIPPADDSGVAGTLKEQDHG